MESSIQSHHRISIETELSLLLDVLRREREAILTADARAISALTIEKDNRVRSLEQLGQGGSFESDGQISEVVMEVSRLARQNAILLRDMQRHYAGMLELLLRKSGQATTYTPHGEMDLMMSSVGPTRMTV